MYQQGKAILNILYRTTSIFLLFKDLLRVFKLQNSFFIQFWSYKVLTNTCECLTQINVLTMIEKKILSAYANKNLEGYPLT
jgi:hypothetical protein